MSLSNTFGSRKRQFIAIVHTHHHAPCNLHEVITVIHRTEFFGNVHLNAGLMTSFQRTVCFCHMRWHTHTHTKKKHIITQAHTHTRTHMHAHICIPPVSPIQQPWAIYMASSRALGSYCSLKMFILSIQMRNCPLPSSRNSNTRPSNSNAQHSTIHSFT